MKSILLIIIFFVPVFLFACSATATPVQTTPTHATAAPATGAVTPSQPIASDVAEETQIKALVMNFGKRLQTVSLLAPDAGQEIQKQYAEFIAPALLELWVNDVSQAPGRKVSSPWPDHIEIATLSKEGSETYVITGSIVEVTSEEVVNGGAAAQIPIRIVVKKKRGGWLITEFKQEG